MRYLFPYSRCLAAVPTQRRGFGVKPDENTDQSHSVVKRKKSSYYGGDKVNYEDEVSYKLHLSDCRRRQADLYPAYLFKPVATRMLLTAPTPGEMLVFSGQSRLHLHTAQQSGVANEYELNASVQTQLQSSASKQDANCNGSTDFSIFAVGKEVVFPSFPADLEDEADNFRSHGFPLLVWPVHLTTKSLVQQYLSDNYPDCAYCFRELDKVTAWLEQKWVPLAKSVGQFEDYAKVGEESAGKSVVRSQVARSQDSDAADDRTWIVNLPKDSVAACYCRQRLAFYQKYASLLQSYLIHRRSITPGFQYNSIHRELRELAQLRSTSLANDAGFFNVVGNHLLKAAKAAKLNGKALDLNAHKFAASLTDVSDENSRRQCIHSLLSAKALRSAMARAGGETRDRTSKRVKKKPELTTSNRDSSDAEASDASSVKAELAEVELQTGQASQATFPNRPITKEIMENRGLVKYRHKRERNPRVHLRHKYHKATVRYRSRVAPNRTEQTPYSGETKGIRVHLVKSHKFKRA